MYERMRWKFLSCAPGRKTFWPGCGVLGQPGALSGQSSTGDAVGLTRLTKQAKFCRFCAGVAESLITSAPPVRSAPWQVERAQPAPRRCPVGSLRSIVPNKIGWISEVKTSRLNLSGLAQLGETPPPPLAGAAAAAALIQSRMVCASVAEATADLPRPC